MMMDINVIIFNPQSN